MIDEGRIGRMKGSNGMNRISSERKRKKKKLEDVVSEGVSEKGASMLLRE